MLKRYFKFILPLQLLVVVFLCSPTLAQQQKRQKKYFDTSKLKPNELELDDEMPGSTPPGVITTIPPAQKHPGIQTYTNINLSNEANPQNEPSVKISRKDPTRAVAAWRDFRTGVNPPIRRIGYTYTTNSGSTWSTSALLPIVSAEYPRSSDPAVTVDTAGNFYIATISITDRDDAGKIIIFKSTDQGVTFNSTYAAPADTENIYDDKEYIVCDYAPSSPYCNNLYISWTRFTINSNFVGNFFTRSTDGGATWSPSLQFNEPGNGGQGSDPVVGPNGDIYVVWASGSVMFDKSTNGGTSFGTDQVLPIDADFGFPSIAVDGTGGPRNGNIYVVSTDTRNGDRDIYFTSSTNGGATWSSAVRVNDDNVANGKFQYWPWIGVDEWGNIAIVYLDTRNTTGNSIFESYIARSTDGGQTFTNEQLGTAQSASNTPNSAVRFGDYIGIDAWGGKALPVWTDERAGGFDMDIYSAVIPLPAPLTFDYKSLQILSPPSGFHMSADSTLTTISTTIKNNGFFAQTDSFDMLCRVSKGVTEVFSSTKRSAGLGVNEMKTVSFDGSFTPTDTGFYTLQTIIEANDQDSLNDTLTTTFGVHYQVSLTVNIDPRWNLISVPVQLHDTSVASCYPSAFPGTTYSYDSSYHPEDTLVLGKGYWTKFPSPIIQSFGGSQVQSISLSLHEGWNLIGSIDHEIAAPSGGIIQSSLFGYHGGYRVESTMKPGHGYWVKTNSDGMITIGPSILPKEPTNDLESHAQILLTDKLGREQTLYLGLIDKKDLSLYSMPPHPPTGAFDIRFTSDRILEGVTPGFIQSFPIFLSGVESPLTITWIEGANPLKASIVDGGKEIDLISHRKIELQSTSRQLVLKVTDGSIIPQSFALYQNYPNPFNPSTEIKFDIATPSDVVLKIYDVLGQEITTLVNEKKAPGSYRVDWDASYVPTGMYFYKLQAGAFHSTRKLVLIK